MRATPPHPKLTLLDGLSSGAVPFLTEVSHDGDASTVHVTGELDAVSSSALEDLVIETGGDGRTVHLDLTETTFIDSAGIRVLVRAMWALQGAGSRLTVTAVSEPVENILRITGILDVLKDPTP
jgi:anti-anti-sigma factor